MKGKRFGIFFGILILFLLALACALPAQAATAKDYTVSGRDYTLPEDSNYDYTGELPTNKFFYGAESLGTLHVLGMIEKEASYSALPAYGATGTLYIHYSYNGAYQKTDEESWHVENDGTRWIRDYDLGFLNNIASGCIMIEKTTDGSNWEKVIDPLKNYFDKAKSTPDSLILTIPESDYMNGTYYRVVVAYKFSRKTKSAFLADEYDRMKCVEVYEFYVASEKNYVTVSDLVTKENLPDQGSTDAGFMIRKNGSQAAVTVNGEACQDFAYFAEPGEYQIGIITKLGKEYGYTVSVEKGLDFTALIPKIYESEKDKGFPQTKYVNVPAFGSRLTSLSLAISKGYEIKQNRSSYGITGNHVSLYLGLNKSDGKLNGDWELSSSSKNQVDLYGVDPDSLAEDEYEGFVSDLIIDCCEEETSPFAVDYDVMAERLDEYGGEMSLDEEAYMLAREQAEELGIAAEYDFREEHDNSVTESFTFDAMTGQYIR